MRFAGTFYFLALMNRKDNAHAAAMAISSGPESIVTTDWVLLELADAMSSRPRRGEFWRLFHLLRSDPRIQLIAATRDLLIRAMKLFESRPDKDWSLTDCTSFVTMNDLGITDALTGDHHFEQAGFRALLR